MPQELLANRSEATAENLYAAPKEEVHMKPSKWIGRAWQTSTGFYTGYYGGIHFWIAETVAGLHPQGSHAFHEVMFQTRDMVERVLDISHGTSSEGMVENILGGAVGALVGLGIQVGAEMSGYVVGKTMVTVRKMYERYSKKQVTE